MNLKKYVDNFKKYKSIIFKSKISTTLLLVLVFFLFDVTYLSLVPHEKAIAPSIVLYILFGFIFGFIGFFASFIGELLTYLVIFLFNLTSHNFDLNFLLVNLKIESIDAIIHLIVSYLFYKAWYSFKIGEQNVKLIRLDSLQKNAT